MPGGADDIVYSALLQPDGKIVVAGDFTHLGGAERNRIGRLNSDGSLDATFDPNLNNSVYTLALQADGKILLGGTFTTIGLDETDCKRIGRLNADGTLDTSFAVPGGVNMSVRSIAIQADGKIIIGGAFTKIGDLNKPFIVRLNSDGSLDTDYDTAPGANDTIHSLVLQPDGKTVVGGNFTLLTGDLRCRLGRLSAGSAAIQNLRVNADATALTWTRAGCAPELDMVAFQQSMDGSTWTSLGAGTRTTNGWQLAGLSLPLNANLYLRARGYYRCGYFNNSISACESVCLFYLTPPVIAFTNISGTVTATVDSTACILYGTANNVVDNMRWTNSLTAASGLFPAAATWSVTNIALLEGTNVLTVSGSNTLGAVASASINLVVPWSKPLAADFDGDGLADPAAYIGADLYVWLSMFNYSRMGPLAYGVDGALPVAGDFDGDRLADPAAYLGVNWYAWLSTMDYAAVGPYAYGLDGATPLAADFDGDRLADPAVYVGINLYAWLSGSGYEQVGPYAYGIAGATPVAADFDGDRFADPAAYLDGNWTAWLSTIGYAEVGPYAYGFAGAVPIAADFDGDGLGDVAVSYNRQWYAWLSSMGYVQIGPYAFNLQE